MRFRDWLFLVTGVVVLIVLGIFLYPPLRRRYYRNNTVRIYYRTVRKVALYFDFYLINQLILKLDADSTANIDHVIFGDKYIYVIKDRYYNYSLSGKADDQMLVGYTVSRRGVRKETSVENPLAWNRVRVNKLALITGQDRDLFISVILVNDGCDVSSIVSEAKNEYVICRRDLYRLVQAVESRPVAKLNPDQLHTAVHDIDRLNQRNISRRHK